MPKGFFSETKQLCSIIAHLKFIYSNFSTFPFKFNRFSSGELEVVAFSTPSAFSKTQFPLFY